MSSSTTGFQKGSARMFESNFLEWFSHVHPVTPLVIFVPVIIASLSVSVFVYDHAVGSTALWLGAGYFTWTLLEYWLHRLVFHLPVKGPITQRAYFFLHGVHHDWPWDTSRLVMPPAVSISLATLFYFAFGAVLDAGPHHAAFAGLVVGYLIYDMIHWYTHAGAPKSRYFKFLRREHMVHHFKEPHSRYGVSCPWWDTVFGTTGTAGGKAADQ